MTKTTRHVCLVVAANPNFYPHIERHTRSLLKVFAKVSILCIGEEKGFPQWESTHFYSMQPVGPQGVRGFLSLMRSFKKKLAELKPDCIEAIDPPALYPAALYLSNKRIPLVYFSMEYYLEQAHIKSSFFRSRIWEWLERQGLQKAQSCATVSPGVAALLTQRFKKSFVVVRNLPYRQKKQGLELSQKGLVYQGLLEKGRGVDLIAEQLQSDSTWPFTVIGGGPLETEWRARFEDFPHICFTGWLPYEESLIKMSQASASVIWIEPLGLSFKHCLPGKLFESVQLNLPVLVSDLPDMKKIVEEYQIGEVGSFNSEGLARSIDRLKAGIVSGKYIKGLNRAQEELCWEKEEEIFLNLFRFD